jgi:hypothetical protein
MDEAGAGTSTVTPVDDIDSVIDVDNIVNDFFPTGIGAFDQRTPNIEVPTYITCNPNRSPRDKSIKDMVNKEDGFDEGYDSDGKLGPFNNVTDKEGQQIFNKDDDDGVCFVAERSIENERDVGSGDMVAADDIEDEV